MQTSHLSCARTPDGVHGRSAQITHPDVARAWPSGWFQPVAALDTTCPPY